MRSILNLDKGEKSQMGTLVDFMLLLAVIAIVAVLVFTVNEDARADLTAGSAGYNATVEADQGVGKVTGNLTLIGTAVVFSVILFIILRILPRGAGGSFG